MQYMINSRFVSWACSVNLAIFSLMIVTHDWMLYFTEAVLGVLFNCYVLLYTKRKLGFLTTAVKFLPTIDVFKTFTALEVYTERFLNTILKAVLELINPGSTVYGFLSYLHPTRTKESKASSTTLLVDNKALKMCTPDLTTSSVIKPAKTQSDPLSRKLNFRKKYLPAQSPELFKNKIYITRRNLTNTLND